MSYVKRYGGRAVNVNVNKLLVHRGCNTGCRLKKKKHIKSANVAAEVEPQREKTALRRQCLTKGLTRHSDNILELSLKYLYRTL